MIHDVSRPCADPSREPFWRILVLTVATDPLEDLSAVINPQLYRHRNRYMNHRNERSDLALLTLGSLRKRVNALAVLVTINFFYAISSMAAEAGSAEQLLESVKAEMLQALRDPEVRADENRLDAIVKDVLLPHVDMQAASQLVLAGHWQKATADQRSDFVYEFERFLMRFYLKSLSGYLKSHDIPDDFMVINGSTPVGKNAAMLVETTVFSPGGTDLPVSYRLRKTDNRWRVIDISVSGISMILTYRKQFGPILQSDGIDGLIAQLRERNAQLVEA